MTSKWRKSPPELIEHFIASTAKLPNSDARKMFGYPCCFVNGNMYTGLHQESWIIRLGEDAQKEIMRDFETEIFEASPGRPMKQYVVLPEEIINNKALLKRWLERSLAYAQALPLKEPKTRVKKPKA